MSFRKDILLNLMGSIVPMAITLITVPIYLKLIGIERYGTLAILWTLMGYFGFMDLGLGRAVAQRMAAQGRSAYGRSGLVWTALTMTLVLGTLGGLVLWLSADFVMRRWIDMSPQNLTEVRSAIPWFVVAMPLIFSASILGGALHGRQHFLAINMLGIIGTVLGQGLPLGIAALGYIGLEWLVPAALSARLVTFIINFHLCRINLPLRSKPHFHAEHLRPLLNYGGWVSVTAILAPLLVAADRFVIGMMTGVKSVAFYTVPYNFVANLLVFPSSIYNALFPRLVVATDRDGRELVDKASRSLLAVMTLLALPAIALVHPFLIWWVGAEFAAQARGIGELLLLGVLINGIVQPHHARLMASGKPRFLAGIYLAELPVYFLLLWLGLSHFGILGAALAWSARVLIDTALLLWASSALRQGISYSFFPLSLGAAAVLIALKIPPSEPLRWYLISLLMTLLIRQSWELLNGLIATVVISKST